MVNSRVALAIVLALGAQVRIQGARFNHAKTHLGTLGQVKIPSSQLPQPMSQPPQPKLSLLEVETGVTATACLLYPVLEKKFGTPVKFAGYEVDRCLGRGEQGEVWLVKDAVLKVLYSSAGKDTAEHACRFAKGVHPRDPEHFVNCLGTGSEELDMLSDDASLPPRMRPPRDCNLCPGSALKSMTIAGDDDGSNYTCLDAQNWITSAAGAEMGCATATQMWSDTCCSADGDYKYNYSSDSSKLVVHYSIEGLAPGNELRDFFATTGVSEIFPTLDDAFKLMIDMAQITDNMMVPTEEDPSEYYHADLHLANVMVTSQGNIKLIDYGGTYMCCNHDYPNATSKCGDLPKCDQATSQKYQAYTNNFLFFDLVEILTGRYKTSWAQMLNGFPFMGYYNLPWLPGSKKDLTPAVMEAEAQRFVSRSVKMPYRLELADLGDIGPSIIVAGLNECTGMVPSHPHPMITLMKTAREKLKNGKTQLCARAVDGSMPRDSALERDKVFCKCQKGMLPTGAKCGSASRKFDPTDYEGKGCKCEDSPGSHCLEIKYSFTCMFTQGCKCNGWFGCGPDGCRPA